MSKRPHEAMEDEEAVVDEKPMVDGKPMVDEKPMADGKTQKKHTLDSDEEDDIDNKKYNLMDPEEIEGEEDDTIAKDGDIQITPFNMKEEMNEGHFDAEGNYYWKKEVEIRDAWLDNIDDAKQHFDPRGKKDSDDESSDDQQEVMKDSDKAAIYEQMLELMQPKETVAKALRRLGGNKSRHSASARWKQKRAAAAAAGGGGSESEAAAEDRQRMERLTGLADRLLSQGNMEVYQMTREAVNHQLEQLRKPVADRLQGATDDDALDIFGDSLDKKPVAGAAGGDGRPADKSQASDAADKPGRTAADNGKMDTAAPQAGPAAEGNGKAEADDSTAIDAGDALTWEFKWDDSEDAEVHGPHTSSEMHAWSESGYFSDAVLVRKTGSAAFYQVKRVDFEIYV